MTDLGPAYRPIGPVALFALRGYAWLFLALVAVAVFLGLPLHGAAIVPHGAVLLAPAGLQILLAVLVRQLGLWPYAPGHPIDRVYAGALTVIGVALVGFGMVSVQDDTAWRLLTLPFLIGAEAWILRTIADPERRNAFFSGARTRGGSAWAAWSAAGLPLVALGLLFGIAWSVGAISVS